MESFKIISEIEKSHINSLAQKNQRIDGRDLKEFREILIELDPILKAEGSARVKIGNTDIVAGIKVTLGPPFSDTPNEGVVTVNAELTPLASPVFEPGPPGEESVEFARVVDRGIRHSNIVDYSKLCLIPEQSVFIVFIDLYVISYDGNLFDCGTLAAVSALLRTKIPKTEITENDVVVLGNQYSKSDWQPLPVTNRAVSVTIAKIGNKLLIDPNENEERVMDTRLTITVDESENICSIQKGREGFFTAEEILEAVNITLEKSKDLFRYLPSNK